MKTMTTSHLVLVVAFLLPAPLRSGSSDTSSHSPTPRRPIKRLKMHPLFGNHCGENSSGSSSPNIPSLPHFPVVMPDDNLPNPNLIPANVPADALEADSYSNNFPNQLGSDTDDPLPEIEPDPEGIVQQYLLDTMKDIRDKQLPSHGSPDCYRVRKSFWIRPPDRWFSLEEYKTKPQNLVPDPLYYPDIFVWLLKSLMPKDFNFRCIFCGSANMSDYGWNRNPVARWVVNLDSCYFILSRRVRCESSSCHKSRSLYEDKLLAQLPKHLANKFPAFLTHRSGIDKKVLTLIRSSIAHALTSNAWERIFQELHVRNRDLAEQAYLHALKGCSPLQLPEKLIPFSSFHDKKGFAGFTPSRWYINSVYVDHMSYVKPYQDQAMSAIPATTVSWDQSFKVPKYVARINGVRVFGSLWTMLNDSEQVRQINFMPTQHLHHIEAPLKGVVRSLHEHGHQPISFVWTDNMKADHAFAERVIPTLRTGLDSNAAVNTTYPAIIVPSDIIIHVASSLQLIDQACSSIMATIGDETTGRTICVGFSVECDWKASQAGHFPAALMQFAMKDVIYLLQIYQIGTAARVGSHIQGTLDLLALLWDLKRPEGKAWGKDFGWVDIGVLARSKGLVPSAKEIRLSDWCRQELSEDQKQYAIRNAWVALDIYKAIVERPPAGARLSKAGLLGEAVTLKNGSVNVAHGFFPEQPTKFSVSNSKIVNISRTKRAVITITDVVAPAFICHYHGLTLADMGAPPFDIVVDLPSLISREKHTMQPNPLPLSLSDPELSEHDSDDDYRDSASDSDTDSQDSDAQSCEEDPFEWEVRPDSDPESGTSNPSTHISVVTPAAQSVGDEPDEYEEYMDAEMDAIIATHPDPVNSTHHPLVQPSDTSLPRPTRTLQDIWHEMRRVTKTIDSRHSLAKQFARWLQDAILVPDKIDRAMVEAVLKKAGITWAQAVRSKPEWVWERVRRYIPPAEYLILVLETLFKTHADAICSTHGIKLFNAETHKAAQLMLEDVRRGWLSDPAGVAVYNRLRTDKNGLTIWHDIRGTNSLEGFHRILRDRFGSLGASVELSMALLSDFCYWKNVESLPFESPREVRPGYLNVSLFKKTEETFIVTALPQTVRDAYDIPRAQSPEIATDSMLQCIPFAGLSGARNNRYEYLASAQDTKFAVTPIHTNEEYSLFNKALRPSGAFSVANGPPDFRRMAKWWSAKVDRKKIFFKFPEHFQAHFKTWNALRAELTTMQLTEKDRSEFMDVIRSDAHTSLVLDESYSPVVQGRKAFASSAKIAVHLDCLLLLPPSCSAATDPVPKRAPASSDNYSICECWQTATESTKDLRSV
ncbi:hypothetical protein MVEN_00288100 [Mycena venus]|uniref:DUF6729 domain-containing protein n=1 Tax=Mycena venus TaxID=2733690 RepID=A0A8H6Z485_9AGAR|nr:hypothetical protein MVEN_00288100 [Mycena venus]